MPNVIEGQTDVAVETAASLDVGAAVVLIAAAGLFALIARRVSNKSSEPFDREVREEAQAHRTGVLDALTKPITLLSMPLLVVSATAALVAWLKHDGRDDAALAIGFTPIAAATVGQSFTSFFDQRDPPDKAGLTAQSDQHGAGAPNGKASEASFPSGHTTGVTAEALGVAYILTREQLATPAIVGSLVAWPLVVGVTRVYRDRHWASDILAGWVAGVGVAALTALLYEWRRSTADRSASRP
jgi:undecaprenyl-diphosphatase